MRDIGRRIQRYRLSRYATPQSPLPRWLRGAMVVVAIWMVWASFISNHSFYRIWRLRRENEQALLQLVRIRREVNRLDREMRDPVAQRERAERQLRENGMARPGEIIYRIRGESGDSLARE